MGRIGCCCCGGTGSCRTGGAGSCRAALVDEGEEPIEAAARELEEQTGYGAGQLVPLISFQAMAETADSEHVVFAGRDSKQIGQAVADEGIGRAEWVPLASVPGLISAGQVWNSASVVGLLQFL